jgi:hypothetical protein
MSNSGPTLEESLAGFPSLHRGPFPVPPRLHWTVLILIGFIVNVAGKWLTFSGIASPWIGNVLSVQSVLFAWLLVQASFVQRLSGSSFVFTTAAGGFVIAAPVLLIRSRRFDAHGWASLLPLVGAAMLLMDLFRMRSALERHYNAVEPYELSMQGVPLFLLGPIYLQYHLRNIALWKARRPNAVTP